MLANWKNFSMALLVGIVFVIFGASQAIAQKRYEVVREDRACVGVTAGPLRGEACTIKDRDTGQTRTEKTYCAGASSGARGGIGGVRAGAEASVERCWKTVEREPKEPRERTYHGGHNVD